MAARMNAMLLGLAALVLGAAAQEGLLGFLVGKVLETTGDVLTADDFSNIRLTLYTNSTNSSYLIANATYLLKDPLFDATKPTVLYAHGWTESSESESVGVVSRAFLQRDSHNFVLIDWSEYVATGYIISSLRVPGSGEAVGKAINQLVAAGLAQDSLWLIGHSLGGQLVGAVAHNLDFKPTRITGLDPAGPLYTAVPLNPGLTRDDADMVDVIHTDADLLGYAQNDGTIDFWPNGGRRPQPGCNVGETDIIDAIGACSHQRSWRFFAASVNNETAFPAVSCRSWLAFEAGKCPLSDNNTVFMGFATPVTNLTGTFYLRTGDEKPYGLGLDGASPASAVPETTTLESTTLDSTTPEGTTLESTTPETATLESTTPETTTLESTTLDSTTAETTSTLESTTLDSTTSETTTAEATSSSTDNSTLSGGNAAAALKLFLKIFS